MEQIRLDIIPKGITPVCHASQYDSGRVIRLNLVDGLQGYVLTDETVEIDVRKPDGHIVTAAATATSGNTYVDIVTTEQMTAVAGENICELKISKTGVEIYSLNFKMQVEKSVLEGGDPSESFIYNLDEQIAEAVAGQYSGDVIFDDEPTAGHGTGYAVTSDGVKDAIDDAVDGVESIIENLSIRDLTDVDINNPQTNEALVFDNDGNLVNGTVSTVGSLDDLSDVDTTGKVENSSVVWNGNDKFIAKKLTVELTQAEYDQLKLDGDLVEGTNYIITDGQNVTCDLGDLDDVTISSASNGDVLAYNNGAWVNSNPIVIKYVEKNVALDSTGEGTLFATNVCVVGIKDIPSDSLYVGYVVYFAGSQTKVKSVSRASIALTSQGIVSMTRKIGIYYLDNISVVNA